jgi:hypothetical protein
VRCANEVHANEVRANEVHANEVHANEVYVHEAHVNEVHANELHANEGFYEDLARQNTVARLFQRQLGFRRCHTWAFCVLVSLRQSR